MLNIDVGVIKVVAKGLAETAFGLSKVDVCDFSYHKGKGRAYYDALISLGANIESDIYRSQLRQILQDAFDAQIEALTDEIIRSVENGRPRTK